MSIITTLSDSGQSVVIDQTEENEAFFKSLSSKVLLFYAAPLVQKWLRTFKNNTVLIIADEPIDLSGFEKRFKATQIEQVKFDALADMQHAQTAQWDIILCLHPEPAASWIEPVLALLKPGGAFLLASRNLKAQWSGLKDFFLDEGLLDLYRVGFHPKGAIAWWPMGMSWLLPFGKLIDALSMFFPGRYELGLNLGHCWMIRGFKRNDVTLFS